LNPIDHLPPSEALLTPRLLAQEQKEGGSEPAGVSAAWRKLMAQARLAAPHLRLATIEGEAGTGKTLLAHYLHRNSPLEKLPFIRQDARQWLASETDLNAVNGFLYLDRVELLEGTGQNLLHGLIRAHQERVHANLILVVSSQSSLHALAGKGEFLPDLAFRLAAVRFAIPALRFRKEDIPPIAQALLDRIGQRYQLRSALLGPGTMPMLLQHSWPGNVRELASVIEAGLLEATNGIIQPGDLNLQQGLHLASSSQGLSQIRGRVEPVRGSEELRLVQMGATDAVSEQHSESLNLDEVIRRHVVYVLQLSHGNKLRAAQILGISRSTLYRILGDPVS
jgi:two-component system response regulator AtoC